ncbi:MAG: biotin--[acetyl-CoA-carboxylase] ligase [Deltaproteobacteria bacterium]|nr:biotin--[acetyl-CoA-carboxylase] ligase [Deltaproteobacteria bacterium]
MPKQVPSQAQEEPIWQRISRSCRLDDRPLILFDAVDSTNTQALALAKEGAESGTVVIAQTQSNGRGRLGRTWESPKGAGLYFSIITRPPLQSKDLSKITLAVGLALRNGVAKVSAIEARLKWPNDLLFAEKKMAGVLTENDMTAGSGPTIVIGIGLNVNTTADTLPVELAARATSMYIAAGRFFDRGAVLAAVLREVDREIARLVNNDFGGILADWRANDAAYGKWLTWLTPKGQKITGLSLGPDEEGLLHIRDAGGTNHPVLSGDLEITVAR